MNVQDYRFHVEQTYQTVMQHKAYIDQLIDNFNTYGSNMQPQSLNEMVNQIRNSVNYLKTQLGTIDQLLNIASMCGDNETLFRVNNIRSTIMGMENVANNFLGHIYNQFNNQYNRNQVVSYNGYNGYNMTPAQQQMLPTQVFQGQYAGFGQAVSQGEELMINSRTNPAGWSATNISGGDDLEAYEKSNKPTPVNATVTQVVSSTQQPVQPSDFNNEFDAFNGNSTLDELLKQYNISNNEIVDISLLDKNNEDILTATSDDTSNKTKIEELESEIKKLKEELKMERGVKENPIVDISFNDFLLDQDNKSMVASYSSNGLKIMSQVGELPKPINRDIEIEEYTVPDGAVDNTTLTFNNLIESSMRRTILAEALTSDVNKDRILICTDFISSIVSIVNDKTYPAEEGLEERVNTSKALVEEFTGLQERFSKCTSLVEIYDTIEDLDWNEFGKKVSKFFKDVIKDELNDFFRYSIETLAGNLIRGELDHTTVTVIDKQFREPPSLNIGWLETAAAKKVYESFIENLKELLCKFYGIVDVADSNLPDPESGVLDTNDDIKNKASGLVGVSVYLRVKTRTFGIRFDDDLDRLTNGKQLQGVVTQESNPELHNILDHCITDQGAKRSTLCKKAYVPGNNHIMICGNPGINVCYRIYPRYDVKGDEPIRKGFFIKLMSSY